MQKNNFLKIISPSVRLICLIILGISMIIAKSIYLILFITTLILILCIYSKKQVKEYVKSIKNIILVLVFFTILYIIISRNYSIFGIFIFFYKSLAIWIMIKLFDITINFSELHSALYGLLIPFKKLNLEKNCYNIAMSLFFIKNLIISKNYINSIQDFYSKRSIRFKDNLYPRFIYSIDKANKLQESNRINHYTMPKLRLNLWSIAVLIFAIIFFVVCLYKEVI